MKHILSWIKSGLKSSNPEIQQSMMRLLVLFFMGGIVLIHGSLTQWVNIATIGAFWAFLMVHAMSLYLIIISNPFLSPIRRVYGILTDVVTISIACWYGGTSSAAYVFIFTWICIGNGYRYGPNYMILASMLSITSLSYVIRHQWHIFSDFENTIIIFNIIIAFYVWFVLHRTIKIREEVSTLAFRDDLTGLPNRAALTQFLDQSIENSIHNHIPLACIYFDLDGFKQVNDTLGHQTGDKLLVQIGRELKSLVPSQGFLSRIAGDEFAIILSDKHIQIKAQSIAEQALHRITHLKKIAGQSIDIGASFGITFYDGLSKSNADQILQKADQLMYQSKNTGKRKITVES